MNIKDFFLPAWKNSNPSTRIKAIQEDKVEPNILENIILDMNEIPDVRKAAALKLKKSYDCERIFQKIYGNESEEIIQILLRNISDEERIRFLYQEIRKAGGKSFLEVPLELRLFEIWEDQVNQTEDSGILLNIAHKARFYPLGSYVSCRAYGIVEKALAKITDFYLLTEWFMKEFKSSKELHYSIRNGLYAISKKSQPDFIFAHIEDLDFLAYSVIQGEKEWALAAKKRILKLGKKIVIEEIKMIQECTSCKGSGGGDVRVPYTDNDWEWEECKSCKGRGEMIRIKKEYHFEDINK